MTKRRPTVEEELFIMIYKLIEKKTSQIFRKPVDAAVLPDYYEKIKKPIDIQTIIKRLKEGFYQYAIEIKESFTLVISNCRAYNVRMDIIRAAEKFQKSIQTEWGNFQKECKRYSLDINEPLRISDQTLRAFELIEEKYNRKPQMLQNILGELQQPKKHSGELKILPPIPQELLQNDKQNDDLPSELAYQPLKYSGLPTHEKVPLFHFDVDCAVLGNDFQEKARMKLNKYRKILNDKLGWIDRRIFRRCLQRKRFRKMATVSHLVSYFENDKLIGSLQLRNIQMFVKMVAYWIQQYPEILSFNMKNKLIDNFKAIKRAIFRVLRYRKQPRSTKIQVDLNEDVPAPAVSYSQQVPPEQQALEQLPEDQSRRYDNEIKNFKRLLAKDQSETIKKWTKIAIKWQGGEWTISEFNSQNVEKKKNNRISSNVRDKETTEDSLRLIKQKRKKQDREEDEAFLSTFRTNSSLELINTFRGQLQFDWDEVFLSKLPPVIQFHPETIEFTQAE